MVPPKTKYLLPNAAKLTQMFNMLFGGKVPVVPGKRLDIKPGCGNFVAMYVNPEGKPVGAAICDLAFGAYGGAALSMMPVNSAKDAIKQKTLEKTMHENLYEIMNVVSTQLMNESTPHLKLTKMYGDPSELPDEDKAFLEAKGVGRVDFSVNILRYGDGAMSVLVV